MPSPEPAAERPRSKSPPKGPRALSPSRRDRNDRNDRDRSRSPPRKPKGFGGGGGGGGFKWKEKSRRDGPSDDRDFRRGGGGDDRDSYVSSRYRRERSPPRRPRGDYHGRGQERNSYRPGRRDDRDDRDRDGGGGRDRRGPRDGGDRDRDRDRRPPPREERKERTEKPKAAATAAAAAPKSSGGETFIIVTVNDRLGTKAQIPCLASDPVKLFKAQVAARIGRQPHEIMLKRQGERPFKDQLTLEDYGVSNGVQLDLELDTGD